MTWQLGGRAGHAAFEAGQIARTLLGRVCRVASRHQAHRICAPCMAQMPSSLPQRPPGPRPLRLDHPNSLAGSGCLLSCRSRSCSA